MAIDRSTFPLPDIAEPATAPFFEAAARDQIRIPKCGPCDRFVWYPQDSCPMCAGPLDWVAVSGRGTLFSWAVVERVFLPAFAEQVPYVTALVALVEDPTVRLCTYLVDVDAAALVADSPVEVVFRDLSFPTVPDARVRVPVFTVAPH